MRKRPFATFFAALCAFVSIECAVSGQTRPADQASEDKAREYLKKAQDNLAGSQNNMLADMGRGDIGRVQAALGDPASAIHSIAPIHFLKVEALADVARIDAAQGRTSQAVQILHAAVAGLGPAPTPDNLGILGQAEAELGDLEGAQKLAETMKASCGQAQILCAIAGAHANMGDIEGSRREFAAAKLSLSQATDEFPLFRPVGIAHNQLDAGQVDDARQTADEINDPQEKALAYAALAGQLASKGNNVPARELLELARKKIGSGAKVRDAQLLTSFLAGGFIKLGDLDAAKALLAQSRKLADAIDEQSEWRPESLADIALELRAAGDVKAASETMQASLDAVGKINNSGNRTHAFWMIAGFRASAGDVVGAQESIAAAIKGKMDPSETAMQAALVAGMLARAAGPRADLSWIEQLNTAEEKGLAYAGAAAALVARK